MQKSLKPFVVPNLGGHSDFLDYCFLDVTVFNRSYEQLSQKLYFIFSIVGLNMSNIKREKASNYFCRGK